jgi:hypothetical protein
LFLFRLGAKFNLPALDCKHFAVFIVDNGQEKLLRDNESLLLLSLRWESPDNLVALRRAPDADRRAPPPAASSTPTPTTPITPGVPAAATASIAAAPTGHVRRESALSDVDTSSLVQSNSLPLHTLFYSLSLSLFFFETFMSSTMMVWLNPLFPSCFLPPFSSVSLSPPGSRHEAQVDHVAGV